MSQPNDHLACVANATDALPTVAAPLPPCLCRSADTAITHPMLPLRCHCQRHAAAATTALPPLLLPPCHPASLLLAAAELPPPPSPPPLRCRRRPRTDGASAALPAVATLLPRCLCRSADAATALPPLASRCRCRLSTARFRRAAAVLLLLTQPPCCPRRHRATAAATAMLPPPSPLCRRLRAASASLPM